MNVRNRCSQGKLVILLMLLTVRTSLDESHFAKKNNKSQRFVIRTPKKKNTEKIAIVKFCSQIVKRAFLMFFVAYRECEHF